MPTLSTDRTCVSGTISLRPALLPSRGFGALSAVILLAGGATALSLSVLGAAASYADVVFRKELRIQTALDQESCLESLPLVRAKDAFAAGEVSLPEFDCVLDLSA